MNNLQKVKKSLNETQLLKSGDYADVSLKRSRISPNQATRCIVLVW
jgi:hypothetical protein